MSQLVLLHSVEPLPSSSVQACLRECSSQQGCGQVKKIQQAAGQPGEALQLTQLLHGRERLAIRDQAEA